jgi:hypothetical protein
MDGAYLGCTDDTDRARREARLEAQLSGSQSAEQGASQTAHAPRAAKY